MWIGLAGPAGIAAATDSAIPEIARRGIPVVRAGTAGEMANAIQAAIPAAPVDTAVATANAIQAEIGLMIPVALAGIGGMTVNAIRVVVHLRIPADLEDTGGVMVNAIPAAAPAAPDGFVAMTVNAILTGVSRVTTTMITRAHLHTGTGIGSRMTIFDCTGTPVSHTRYGLLV